MFYGLRFNHLFLHVKLLLNITQSHFVSLKEDSLNLYLCTTHTMNPVMLSSPCSILRTKPFLRHNDYVAQYMGYAMEVGECVRVMQYPMKRPIPTG